MFQHEFIHSLLSSLLLAFKVKAAPELRVVPTWELLLINRPEGLPRASHVRVFALPIIPTN